LYLSHSYSEMSRPREIRAIPDLLTILVVERDVHCPFSSISMGART
jgi:hypothetical protein